jgi:hypothetical protein
MGTIAGMSDVPSPRMFTSSRRAFASLDPSHEALLSTPAISRFILVLSVRSSSEVPSFEFVVSLSSEFSL